MKKIIIITVILLISLNNIYAQEVKVNQGKLSVDGLLWATYRNTKDSITINTFCRRNAFIGLTANLTSWASCRLYFDVANISGQPAYDLYATLKTLPNLSFTFGQFKLPLGIEVLTKPENLELVEYSLIGRDPQRTPKGTRDIGVQIAYKHPYTDLTLACVNGNGRNVLQDDNKNKCIAGRVIIKPFQKPSFFGGFNTYFGKYVTDIKFHRIGVELNYTVSPIISKAEFLNTQDGTTKGNGYYVQTGYNWKWLQPMFRYSAFKYESQKQINEFVIGLNIRPLSDNYKLMLNYKTEKLNSTLKQNGFIGQLQIAF